MATKQQDTNWRNDKIRCEYCGEDYSVTYKHCPFCDEKAGEGIRVERRRGKGGKRVANAPKRSGGSMEPVQIIGLVLSFILIIAAVYIVYSVISPLFGGKEPAGSQSSISQSQPPVSASQPDPGVSASGSASGSGDVSDPVVVPPVDTSGVIAPIVTATGIALNKADVTLSPNEVLSLKATLTPAGSGDTVVWASSDESVARVTQDGTVSNVNSNGSQKQATITAKVGDITATCIVRCKGGSTGGTAVAAGTTGTVTGANSGLLIRSGPGRSYEAKDTANNGAVVTILSDAGDGWYEISYTGSGGRTEKGYVSKDFIRVN